jgi:hypothetical protein
MERVSVGEINSKIKTKEDMTNFYREQGKFFINFTGLYFPKGPGFDGKFFLQTLRGEKQVKILKINF